MDAQYSCKRKGIGKGGFANLFQLILFSGFIFARFGRLTVELFGGELEVRERLVNSEKTTKLGELRKR